MEYEVIDTVQGDCLEPGDIVRAKAMLWELHSIRTEDEFCIVWNATNLSDNDGEETLVLDPNYDYDLMGY